MPFGKTYAEIEEMILDAVLDTQMCRDIMRRAGAVASGIASSLAWLIELWFTKEYYNTPINTGGTNYVYRKDNPKKASEENYDIEFQSDHSGWRFTSAGTYDIYDHSPTHWGRANEFYPGSRFTVGAGGFNSAYKTHVFITGSTLYDPFPYPELPCYFYADLKHIPVLVHWYDVRFVVEASGFQAKVPYARPTSAYVETTVPASDPITLKLWASDDNGATWEDPIFTEPGFPTNPHAAIVLNPSFPTTAASLVRRNNSGTVKGKFRRDGILLKYTLEAAVATDRIYLTDYGVRGYEQGNALFNTQFISR